MDFTADPNKIRKELADRSHSGEESGSNVEHLRARIATISVDTVNPISEHMVKGAAIPKNGHLIVYHLTKNPEEKFANIKLKDLVTIEPHGTLGAGLYVSSVPEYWEGLVKKSGGPAPMGIIELTLAGKFVNNTELTKQPLWNEVLEKVKTTPAMGHCEIQNLVNIMLNSMGFSGRFRRITDGGNPELIVWNKKAIINFKILPYPEEPIFAPTQKKLFQGETKEEQTSQVQFKAPLAEGKPKPLMSREEKYRKERAKEAPKKREYGLEAFGVQTSIKGLSEFEERTDYEKLKPQITKKYGVGGLEQLHRQIKQGLYKLSESEKWELVELIETTLEELSPKPKTELEQWIQQHKTLQEKVDEMNAQFARTDMVSVGYKAAMDEKDVLYKKIQNYYKNQILTMSESKFMSEESIALMAGEASLTALSYSPKAVTLQGMSKRFMQEKPVHELERYHKPERRPPIPASREQILKGLKSPPNPFIQSKPKLLLAMAEEQSDINEEREVLELTRKAKARIVESKLRKQIKEERESL